MSNLVSSATKAALEGDWQKAVELNLEILSSDPNDIEALNRLAHALSFLGKTEEAKKTYHRVLRIDPYNHIAKKNLEKLHALKNGNFQMTPGSASGSCLFLEEPGRTKVTNIINPAQQKVLSLLYPGTLLELVVKKHSVCVFKDGEYIGALPDDLSHRLIHLTRLGNKYEAYIKAVEKNNLLVFLKETKRSKRAGSQPSFFAGKTNGFYPYLYSKQALEIDREPPEGSLEEEKEEEEIT